MDGADADDPETLPRGDVIVRRARPDDVDALWPLCVGFGLVSARTTDELTAADRARVIAVVDDPNQCLVVAASSGRLVGYALAQDGGTSLRREWSVARLHDLFVEPRHRRHGVASALHAAIVDWCARRPVRFLEWQASTSAIGFYTSLGYSPDHVGDYPEHPLFEHEFAVG